MGPSLGPRQFTLLNALERLHAKGDPMAAVRGPSAPLQKALERLARLMG